MANTPGLQPGANGSNPLSSTNNMAKEKTLKVKTEVNSLQTVLSKLQEKYLEFPSKELSDAITHLHEVLRCINKI